MSPPAVSLTYREATASDVPGSKPAPSAISDLAQPKLLDSLAHVIRRPAERLLDDHFVVGAEIDHGVTSTDDDPIVVSVGLVNRAADEGSGDGPRPWAKVRAFRGVDAARVRYLEPTELERLLNVCPPDFRDLVTAAVHTGARYGELAALRVADYRPEAKAVHFTNTKTGESRHVYLSDEGTAFFDRLTAGREAQNPILVKADGTSWGRNHQSRPMRDACEAAQISPPVGFHQLRHTCASLYLMSGGSLVALAKQLGHTTTRMVEKHYGHLSDAWRAEEARMHAPRLDSERRTVAGLLGSGGWART